MANGFTSKWKKILHKTLPFLFKKCPGGNLHWFWDNVCYCQMHEYCGDWHGGIYLFQNQKQIYVNLNHDLCVESYPKTKWLPEVKGQYKSMRKIIKEIKRRRQNESNPS